MHCDDGGSHMRKSFVALLLVLGAASLAKLAFADSEFANAGEFGSKLMNAQMAQELRTRAARLGTSGPGPPNDTTWVGFNPAYGGSNYWSIGVGLRHPRGVTGPGKGDIVPVPNSDTGYWTWDTPIHGDSLQGWWPVRNLYTSTGNLTLPDDQRPWWAVDIGNQISYVINQGGDGTGQTHPGVSYRRTFGVTSAWHVDA